MQLLKKLAWLFIIPIIQLNAQTEYIDVRCDQFQDTSTAFMQGFINGGAGYNIQLTQQLKPEFWGFGWDVVADYDYAVPNMNLVKMISIYSAYLSYFGIGDPMLLQPWTSGYVQWDAFVAGLVNQSISTGRPVDYWSVWGEPDASFSGTPAQYIELFRRTDSIVHSIDPAAKMVGPDFITFGIPKLMFFIDTLDQLGIHPAALSWHEFGSNPADVYDHVSQFRDSLAARPQMGNPEIHVQEYGDPGNRLIPGWCLGWLYYFEKSKIDWASRACFNESDGTSTWDDCWDGLSGMYMQDGETTQPIYWLYRAYAGLNRSGRLMVDPSQSNTVALAGRNDASQEVMIVAGRFYSQLQGSPNAPANVEIRIHDYPYANNGSLPVLIQKIPAQTVSYSVPLSAPVNVSGGMLNIAGDSALITLNSFADGDAYIIYINPDPGTVLSVESSAKESGLQVYPNPAASFVRLVAPDAGIRSVSIINSQGKIVARDIPSPGAEVIISTEKYANGIYFVNVADDEGRYFSRKIVVAH